MQYRPRTLLIALALGPMIWFVALCVFIFAWELAAPYSRSYPLSVSEQQLDE
jgi:hypothetical protein